MTAAASARALIIDPDKARARVLMRVTRGVMQHVDMADGSGDIADDYDVVVMRYDALAPPARAQAFERLRPLVSRGRVLLLVDAGARDELPALFGELGLMNMLARSGEIDDEDLLVTLRKIVAGEIFGLEKYFPWGTGTRQWSASRSDERHAIFDEVCAHARDSGISERFVELIQLCVDEMVTNALFNAPTDEHGAALFSDRPRNEVVTLPGETRVDVSVMTDGRRLGLSVRDPFGSLKVNTIVEYLARCMRRGGDQVESKAGGAGLGLFVVFEALSHFIINLAPGRCTEIVGLIDVRGRYKDFAQRPKSFNIFLSS